MPAGTWNTIIEQGASWARTVTWLDSVGTPVNLTGYTAKMQIRLEADSTDLIMELNTTPATGKGTIALGGAAGTIQLDLTAADTAAMSFTGAESGSVAEGSSDAAEGLLGVYDIELTAPGGAVTRLLAGIVCFSAEVTK